MSSVTDSVRNINRWPVGLWKNPKKQVETIPVPAEVEGSLKNAVEEATEQITDTGSTDVVQ